MKSAAVVNFSSTPHSVELREFARPEPGADDIILAVEAVGVCGSDLHQWTGQHSWPVNYPVVLGHEFGGRIASLGPAVKGWSEGDREDETHDPPELAPRWQTKRIRFSRADGAREAWIVQRIDRDELARILGGPRVHGAVTGVLDLLDGSDGVGRRNRKLGAPAKPSLTCAPCASTCVRSCVENTLNAALLASMRQDGNR